MACPGTETGSVILDEVSVHTCTCSNVVEHTHMKGETMYTGCLHCCTRNLYTLNVLTFGFHMFPLTCTCILCWFFTDTNFDEMHHSTYFEIATIFCFNVFFC